MNSKMQHRVESEIILDTNGWSKEKLRQLFDEMVVEANKLERQKLFKNIATILKSKPFWIFQILICLIFAAITFEITRHL